MINAHACPHCGAPAGGAPAAPLPVQAIYTAAQAADYLRVPANQLHRYFMADRKDGWGTVTAHTILRLLKEKMKGDWGGKTPYMLPERLLTPQEAAALLLPTFPPDKGYRRILRFCARRANPPPHFRITKFNIRFDPAALGRWLESRAKREAVLM